MKIIIRKDKVKFKFKIIRKDKDKFKIIRKDKVKFRSQFILHC